MAWWHNEERRVFYSDIIYFQKWHTRSKRKKLYQMRKSLSMKLDERGRTADAKMICHLLEKYCHSVLVIQTGVFLFRSTINNL